MKQNNLIIDSVTNAIPDLIIKFNRNDKGEVIPTLLFSIKVDEHKIIDSSKWVDNLSLSVYYKTVEVPEFKPQLIAEVQISVKRNDASNEYSFNTIISKLFAGAFILLRHYFDMIKDDEYPLLIMYEYDHVKRCAIRDKIIIGEECVNSRCAHFMFIDRKNCELMCENITAALGI